MDPATLGLIGSVASGLFGAVGQISSGMAQASSAKYNAAVARNNQIIAEQNAARAAQAGRIQAQGQDIKNASRMGAIVAGEAASGIDLGSGTSKELQDSAAQLGRLDTATILDNAMQTSRGYSTQAMNFGAQSALYTAQASNAQTAGFLGGANSILGGATSFADKWARFRFEGVGGGSGNTGGFY